MRECPCGFWGDLVKPCRCTDGARIHYRGRLSGPLLDRIDLHVSVPAVPFADLVDAAPAEGSEAVRARVDRVQRIQAERTLRFQVEREGKPRRGSPPWLALDAGGRRVLSNAHDRLGLTARAHTRVLRLARTIADLAGSPAIEAAHLAEAVQYRALDRDMALELPR